MLFLTAITVVLDSNNVSHLIISRFFLSSSRNAILGISPIPISKSTYVLRRSESELVKTIFGIMEFREKARRRLDCSLFPSGYVTIGYFAMSDNVRSCLLLRG